MAKLHATERLCEVLDDCLQLHGGYGYMWEFPIARAWADARMARIAGGSSEIMREIIGRSLFGLGDLALGIGGRHRIPEHLLIRLNQSGRTHDLPGLDAAFQVVCDDLQGCVLEGRHACRTCRGIPSPRCEAILLAQRDADRRAIRAPCREIERQSAGDLPPPSRKPPARRNKRNRRIPWLKVRSAPDRPASCRVYPAKISMPSFAAISACRSPMKNSPYGRSPKRDTKVAADRRSHFHM